MGVNQLYVTGNSEFKNSVTATMGQLCIQTDHRFLFFVWRNGSFSIKWNIATQCSNIF